MSKAGEEMVMLGDYPFYYAQPTVKMDEVFEQNAACVKLALGADLVALHRIGSSAVIGMPGQVYCFSKADPIQ